MNHDDALRRTSESLIDEVRPQFAFCSALHARAAAASVRIPSVSALIVVSVLLGWPSPSSAQQSIGQVAWLQGCWQATSGQSTVDEQWMAPRGSNMLMMGRTVRDGQLVEYEVVVLREDNGTLVYDAHPSGQASALFRATTATNASVLFENPAHDFPRTIGYRLERPDTLLAWVEGPSGGRTRRLEFHYERIGCPGPSR